MALNTSDDTSSSFDPSRFYKGGLSYIVWMRVATWLTDDRDLFHFASSCHDLRAVANEQSVWQLRFELQKPLSMRRRQHNDQAIVRALVLDEVTPTPIAAAATSSTSTSATPAHVNFSDPTYDETAAAMALLADEQRGPQIIATVAAILRNMQSAKNSAVAGSACHPAIHLFGPENEGFVRCVALLLLQSGDVVANARITTRHPARNLWFLQKRNELVAEALCGNLLSFFAHSSLLHPTTLFDRFSRVELDEIVLQMAPDGARHARLSGRLAARRRGNNSNNRNTVPSSAVTAAAAAAATEITHSSVEKEDEFIAQDLFRRKVAEQVLAHINDRVQNAEVARHVLMHLVKYVGIVAISFALNATVKVIASYVTRSTATWAPQLQIDYNHSSQTCPATLVMNSSSSSSSSSAVATFIPSSSATAAAIVGAASSLQCTLQDKPVARIRLSDAELDSFWTLGGWLPVPGWFHRGFIHSFAKRCLELFDASDLPQPVPPPFESPVLKAIITAIVLAVTIGGDVYTAGYGGGTFAVMEPRLFHRDNDRNVRYSLLAKLAVMLPAHFFESVMMCVSEWTMCKASLGFLGVPLYLSCRYVYRYTANVFSWRPHHLPNTLNLLVSSDWDHTAARGCLYIFRATVALVVMSNAFAPLWRDDDICAHIRICLHTLSGSTWMPWVDKAVDRNGGWFTVDPAKNPLDGKSSSPYTALGILVRSAAFEACIYAVRYTIAHFDWTPISKPFHDSCSQQIDKITKSCSWTWKKWVTLVWGEQESKKRQ